MSNHRPAMVIRLEGGLGNQMFQYAFGRSISKRAQADLFFDTTSGFIQDRIYKRRLQLRELDLSIKDVRENPRLKVPNRIIQSHLFRGLIYPARRMLQRRSQSGNWAEQLWPNYSLVSERAHIFNKELMDMAWQGKTWFRGYWQSPHYFADFADEVAMEVIPPRPYRIATQEFGHSLREQESVAVGIRLYEESPWPDRHARDGRLRTVREIRNALAQILDTVPRSRVFVFCTHMASEITACAWPQGTEFVTHEDGRFNTVETLWLLTQSRHHVITNSTFYWWGAWLSHWNYPQAQQTILAADNFPNLDALPVSWKRF